jgi:hypothetical protein
MFFIVFVVLDGTADAYHRLNRDKDQKADKEKRN